MPHFGVELGGRRAVPGLGQLAGDRAERERQQQSEGVHPLPFAQPRLVERAEQGVDRQQRGGRQEPGGHHERHRRGVGQAGRSELREHLGDPVVPVRAGRADDLAEHDIGHGRQQFGLVADVVVERHGLHLESSCESTHRELVEAVVVDEGERLECDALPGERGPIGRHGSTLPSGG